MAIDMIEGSGSAKLRHVIKRLGYKRDNNIELATVTSGLPDIRIKIDNMNIELDADDLVICEHLLPNTRTAAINGAAPVSITFDSSLSVGDRVIVASAESSQLYIVIDRIGLIGDE